MVDKIDIIKDVFYSVSSAVNEGNWKYIFVFPSSSMPSFAYSVGLTKNFNSPEIVLCGLAEEESGMILNATVDFIKKNNGFIKGESIDLPGVFNLPVRLNKISSEVSTETFNLTNRYYESINEKTPLFYQLELSDINGLLSDNKDVDEVYSYMQTFYTSENYFHAIEMGNPDDLIN
jgi:hypothetical protein